MKAIHSFDELNQFLQEDLKSFVLIYKSGSGQSDCAYNHLKSAEDESKNLQVAAVDVSLVRDIHTKFGISSAPSLLMFDGKNHSSTIKGCESSQYYQVLLSDAKFHSRSNIESSERRKNVIVYSTPSCSWCNTLKSWLNKNSIQYRDIDVSKDQAAASSMVQKSGQQGVPQTEIDGQIVVGFDQNKLKNLLGMNR